MELIKEWALSTCVAAVAGGIAYMILPPGNLQKVFKFTISLFFLCCLISPLFLWKNLSLDTMRLEIETETGQLTQQLTQGTDEQLLMAFSADLEEKVRSALSGDGIEAKKIRINVNTDEEMNISISDIQITLKKEDEKKKNKVVQRVERLLEQTPTVTVEDEGESK